MRRSSFFALLLGLGLSFSLPEPGLTKGFHALYDFEGGNDGAHPGSLTMDKSGNIFGTTGEGGNKCNCGTLFKLTAKGAESVLYRFCPGEGCADGFEPAGSLIFDSSGNLYGTTLGGGGTDCDDNVGCGTVFEFSATGKESVLYSFKGNNDGAYPESGVILDPKGRFWGTTVGGGNSSCNSLGCGTVFAVSSDGTENVVHAFQGGSDGASPLANLVMDSAGNFYGTTAAGGGGSCSFEYGAGCGTVFEITASGEESVLYAFQGGSDGAFPSADLIVDSHGNLYGSTQLGGGTGCGGTGCGTVFKLASGGKETVLYRFIGQAGEYPYAGLLADQTGDLFGTVSSGGNLGYGAIFELDTNRKERLLYSFKNKADGENPQTGLIFGKHNFLYGTTFYGGDSPCLCGSVFKIQN